MNTDKFEEGVRAGWSKGMGIVNSKDYSAALKELESFSIKAQVAAKNEFRSGNTDKAYYYRGYMAGIKNADGFIVAYRAYG